MKSANWKDIAELIGIAAIVASLIFVGMEMRQTRVIAMAAAYQARTDSELNMQQMFDGTYGLLEIRRKFRAGEPLTASEQMRRDQSHQVRFMYLENVHYQVEIDMLSDEIWRAQMMGIKGILVASNFRQWWEDNRVTWRPTFAESIDEYIAEFSSN